MLEFRPLTTADREQIHSLLYRAAGHGSEYSFATLFLWGYQQVAYVEGNPVFLSRFGTHHSYPLPLSGDLQELIPLLQKDARNRGIPFRLFGLLPREQERLEELFPNTFRFRPVRDSFDYVYEIDRLAELRGKKLQAKRNHCNRFLDEYPDYRIVPLTEELLPACRSFVEYWYEDHKKHAPDDDFRGERIAISRAFDNFKALEMEGILLEAEGNILGFSMGNRIREDTFDVNFEKALPSVQGAYPMVNREFARLLRQRYPDLRFLNREDDMGIEGLRKAKLSYHPDILLEKLIAEELNP